jgi:hypothetical protein
MLRTQGAVSIADFRTDQEIEIEIQPEANFDSAKAKNAALTVAKEWQKISGQPKVSVSTRLTGAGICANSGGLAWQKQSVSIFNPVSVVQPLWKRQDGATATITGAFITIESPAAKEFLERKAKEETEERHRVSKWRGDRELPPGPGRKSASTGSRKPILLNARRA